MITERIIKPRALARSSIMTGVMILLTNCCIAAEQEVNAEEGYQYWGLTIALILIILLFGIGGGYAYWHFSKIEKKKKEEEAKKEKEIAKQMQGKKDAHGADHSKEHGKEHGKEHEGNDHGHGHAKPIHPFVRALGLIIGVGGCVVLVVGGIYYGIIYYAKAKKEAVQYGIISPDEAKQKITVKYYQTDTTFDMTKPFVVHLVHGDWDFHFWVDDQDSLKVNDTWYHPIPSGLIIPIPSVCEFHPRYGAPRRLHYVKKRAL